MDLKICSTILFLLLFAHRHRAEYLNANDTESLRILVHTGSDIVKSTYVLIDTLERTKQKHMNTPSYEVGYLTFTIMETYRRMIDKYNTSHTMNRQLWAAELILYLEDIEHHYFELDHLTAQNLNDLKRVFNDSIYHELSWSVKLLLIKDYLNSHPKVELTRILAPSPEPKAEPKRRIPRMEALVVERRQDPGKKAKVETEDESSMRLKLFRLMYETIRDSDLKCKRAELIRSHYENSTTFEIGYLMGDVMDKYNIMSDISMTLNRLFHEWKPIEHINAYEQISNQAIEINHLIDLMKSISNQETAPAAPAGPAGPSQDT